MLIKRKDGGNRGFGGHFKMPGKSKDFDLGATWENKVEGLFTKLEASQPSQEDIQKQQEKLRQEQDDAVAAQRKKDEEERARLAEENARRNGPKTTSTTTTTTATTKKPKNEPSTTGASSTFIKLSQVNTARTTSQVSSPSLAKETPVNERPDSSNDVVVVTEVPSTTPPTTLGPNTPEPPAETDPTISTFTPQHTLNAGQIAAIVISSIGLVIILLIAIFLFLRFRRHQQHPQVPSLSNPASPPPNHHHHHHPYIQLLSPHLPPQTPHPYPDVSKPRPTISRWLSQVRAEAHPHHPIHPPSVSLPSSSSHSGSRGRNRGQPDMVSDISSQISGFTHQTVTVSSGGRSFRPPTQLRPPTGSSMGSSGRDTKGRRPAHPSIYISPATATNSSGSLDSAGLLGGFPLPPGRLMGEGEVSPLSPSSGGGMGNGVRLSGLGVGSGDEEDYEESGRGGRHRERRGSWEGDERLRVLEGKRGSV